MNFSAISHQAKSRDSYAYDQDTLHIRLRTAIGEVDRVALLAVDPFNWIPGDEEGLEYHFDKKSVRRVAMDKEQKTQTHDCWFAEVKGIKWKRIKYCFILENGEEKHILGCHQNLPYTDDESRLYDLSNYFNYPYIHQEDLYKAPAWASEMVWYQIFPERFCNGTPGDGRTVLPWGSQEQDGSFKKFGGNLLGIIKQLDYIQEAGFTGIYLTPIFESPSSHKYDTTNYFRIDPEFGDNEIFGRLVEEAHQRGIRIMLDGVFNHCGFQHPFWQDVVKKGKASAYYDCFYILDPDKPVVAAPVIGGVPQYVPRDQMNYRTFAYAQTMPKWNTGNHVAREYLLDVACYWMEKYHIDGWRLDVSNEVSHDFWREFRKRVKALNPDVYIMGENWDHSYPWLMGDQFDGVMNYELAVPVWDYFEGKGGFAAEEFRCAISKLLTDYPRHVSRSLFNMLESHDTQRLMNRVLNRTEIAKLAYVFLFTYPGAPCIYYGGEIGMGGGEHSNRQCMIWDPGRQNQELFDLIRRLVQLRKGHESFGSVRFSWLAQLEDTEILAYKKEAPGETLFVFLHKSEREEEFRLPKELVKRRCRDCMAGKEIFLGETMCIEPNGFRMYMV